MSSFVEYFQPGSSRAGPSAGPGRPHAGREREGQPGAGPSAFSAMNSKAFRCPSRLRRGRSRAGVLPRGLCELVLPFRPYTQGGEKLRRRLLWVGPSYLAELADEPVAVRPPASSAHGTLYVLPPGEPEGLCGRTSRQNDK